jgi:hypothetical protein
MEHAQEETEVWRRNIYLDSLTVAWMFQYGYILPIGLLIIPILGIVKVQYQASLMFMERVCKGRSYLYSYRIVLHRIGARIITSLSGDQQRFITLAQPK